MAKKASRKSTKATVTKVFISWSGERSHAVAKAWYQFLRDLFQTACEPFFSSENIDAGFVWFETLSTELEKTDVGIVCLTPDNLREPWIHFEAGALAKKVDRRRVCTYLLDLRPSDLKAPLSAFNANIVGKDGTRKVVETINKQLAKPLGERALDRTFEKWWPEFETAPEKVPEPAAPASETEQ